MGTYYVAANMIRNEYIGPWYINHGGLKAGPCILASPGLANLVMYQMIYDWHGNVIIMVGDNSNFYEEIEKTFKNITKEVVEKYNDFACKQIDMIISLNPNT